ncbi:hypothetical protein LMG26411_06780 [Cupriavidus numazuensis]|uniref:Uncharacterized protein n=1 Tax=Cupriavidus numazuensis TaxID=221992 RepID=A0ABM8TTC3_9BURK|nr:hypothetical protein LMG26411_06780 [Cupriavidus numazuensis]
MAFVIDGSEWSFDTWTVQEVCTALEGLLERVWSARERGEVVWIGDDLQSRHVLPNMDIWSLCAPDAPITLPIELQHELAAWLGSAPRYADQNIWPDGMVETTRIRVGNAPHVDNPDVAWAHHHVRASRAVACMSIRSDGPHNTQSDLGNSVVHWVRTEQSHREFWRDAIDVERDTEETLERLAPHAFPDLHFHPPVWRQIHNFAGGYNAVRLRLRAYLAALDDHGCWAFMHPPPALRPDEVALVVDPTAQPSNQIVERRFHGMALDIAPENPNVYQDAYCRRARQITIGQRTIYCEWHGKLERHQNRLHIHAPIPESNNKVVIAIFDAHLPIPGH